MDPWNPRAEQRAILDCPKSVTANLQCEPEMPSSQHPTNEGQTEKHPQAKGETQGETRGETGAGRFISTRETKWPKKNFLILKFPLKIPSSQGQNQGQSNEAKNSIRGENQNMREIRTL